MIDVHFRVILVPPVFSSVSFITVQYCTRTVVDYSTVLINHPSDIVITYRNFHGCVCASPLYSTRYSDWLCVLSHCPQAHYRYRYPRDRTLRKRSFWQDCGLLHTYSSSRFSLWRRVQLFCAAVLHHQQETTTRKGKAAARIRGKQQTRTLDRLLANFLQQEGQPQPLLLCSIFCCSREPFGCCNIRRCWKAAGQVQYYYGLSAKRIFDLKKGRKAFISTTSSQQSPPSSSSSSSCPPQRRVSRPQEVEEADAAAEEAQEAVI